MGGGFGNGWFPGTKGGRQIRYPGNDSTIAPGPGFEWRGKGKVGSSQGSWFNPETEEIWHPDLRHLFPVGPHWDYTDKEGKRFRVFPDGRVEPV